MSTDFPYPVFGKAFDVCLRENTLEFNQDLLALDSMTFASVESSPMFRPSCGRHRLLKSMDPGQHVICWITSM